MRMKLCLIVLMLLLVSCPPVDDDSVEEKSITERVAGEEGQTYLPGEGFDRFDQGAVYSPGTVEYEFDPPFPAPKVSVTYQITEGIETGGNLRESKSFLSSFREAALEEREETDALFNLMSRKPQEELEFLATLNFLRTEIGSGEKINVPFRPMAVERSTIKLDWIESNLEREIKIPHTYQHAHQAPAEDPVKKAGPQFQRRLVFLAEGYDLKIAGPSGEVIHHLEGYHEVEWYPQDTGEFVVSLPEKGLEVPILVIPAPREDPPEETLPDPEETPDPEEEELLGALAEKHGVDLTKGADAPFEVRITGPGTPHGEPDLGFMEEGRYRANLYGASTSDARVVHWQVNGAVAENRDDSWEYPFQRKEGLYILGVKVEYRDSVSYGWRVVQVDKVADGDLFLTADRLSGPAGDGKWPSRSGFQFQIFGGNIDHAINITWEMEFTTFTGRRFRSELHEKEGEDEINVAFGPGTHRIIAEVEFGDETVIMGQTVRVHSPEDDRVITPEMGRPHGNLTRPQFDKTLRLTEWPTWARSNESVCQSVGFYQGSNKRIKVEVLDFDFIPIPGEFSGGGPSTLRTFEGEKGDEILISFPPEDIVGDGLLEVTLRKEGGLVQVIKQEVFVRNRSPETVIPEDRRHLYDF